jgi:hypothetical protein
LLIDPRHGHEIQRPLQQRESERGMGLVRSLDLKRGVVA